MSTLEMPHVELTYVIAHMGPLTEDEIYDHFTYKYPNVKNIGLAIEYLEDKMIIENKEGYYKLLACPEDSISKFYTFNIEEYLPEDMNDMSYDAENLREAYAIWHKLVSSIHVEGKKQVFCWTTQPWTHFAETQYQQEITTNLIKKNELEVHYAFNSHRSPLHKQIGEGLAKQQLFEVIPTRKPYDDRNVFLSMVGDYVIKIILSSPIQQKITTLFKGTKLLNLEEEDFSEAYDIMEVLAGQKSAIKVEITRNASKVKAAKKKFDAIMNSDDSYHVYVSSSYAYEDIEDDELDNENNEKFDFDAVVRNAANINLPLTERIYICN